MTPLLLTASVDPKGMKGAMFSVSERENMYINTLNFYIDYLSRKKGCYHIVFAENSGWNPESILTKLKHSPTVEIEYISLNADEYDIKKGKSYNEMLLINQATERSETIKDAGCFFKLTGRYPIKNLYDLLSEVERYSKKHMGGYNLYCDCKDHKVYEWLHMPINGHAGECRYYAVSMDFYNKYFRNSYVELDDSKGKNVEMLFLDVIRKTRHMEGVHDRFWTQAHITGQGGHSFGKKGGIFYSTNYNSPIMKFKMGLRQLLRWVIPFWKV